MFTEMRVSIVQFKQVNSASERNIDVHSTNPISAYEISDVK